MNIPLRLLPLRVWRIAGWAATTILAVAALAQLAAILFVIVPTGALETNASLYIKDFDYPVQFSRWSRGYLLQLALDILYGLGLVTAWWFSYRAVTDLPLPGVRIEQAKRSQIVTHWHEAALMIGLVGIIGVFAGTWQRMWLWKRIILPVFIENQVDFTPIGNFQLVFGHVGGYLNLANLMLLASAFVLLFFEKLEAPASVLGYDYEAELLEAEFLEPPSTTSMLALQAIPASMRRMPAEMRALPLRWWKRFVNAFK